MPRVESKCTKCGRPYRSKKSDIGKKVQCKKCGASFMIQPPPDRKK